MKKQIDYLRKSLEEVKEDINIINYGISLSIKTNEDLVEFKNEERILNDIIKAFASSEKRVRSIFKEIQIDQNSLNKQDRHTEDFKEGFKEAVRTLAIIIEQETEIDVRK